MNLLKWFVKPLEDFIQQQREQGGINSILNQPSIGVVVDELKINQVTPIVTKTIKENNRVYRPLSFSNYIGQEKAKDLLKAYLEGTKSRNKEFPHMLIYGQAGCGKTTLARIVAKELGLSYQEVISSTLTDSYDLISLVEELDGGILFLDEIHALEREVVEPIYTVMEDFTIDEEQVKPFTIIGATTEIGEVIKYRRPFYDRFKIKLELEDYTVPEISKIVKQYKINLFPKEQIDSKVISKISANSRLTPRKAISLLETSVYLNGNIEKALMSNRIIYGGYTDKDLKTLEYIELNKSGVGLEAIASYLGTSKDNFSYDIEPWLLKNRMIVRTPRGRKITEDGIKLKAILKRRVYESKE